MKTIRIQKPGGKKPKCRFCGSPVLYGNLFCSAKCGANDKTFRAQDVKALEAQGFVQDKIPNIYRKDGVAVTLEHVAHVGLEKALQLHQQATQAQRA